MAKRWVAPAMAAFVGVLLVFLGTGCSVKKFAINKLGDSLAQGTSTFATDDDLQLVGDALPFSLKLIESLLAESPKHRGLLFAASSGFTQYAYVYVQQPADELESTNIAKCLEMRTRARRLYIRARTYGFRGLEVAHPGFEKLLRERPEAAAALLRKSDVPLVYWTAAAMGAAVSVGKDDAALVADLGLVQVLIDRALALDENFDHGAIHSFLIAFEPARPGAEGDPLERSRKQFDAAVRLSQGQQASPYVSYAETVSIAKGDRGEFRQMLEKALAVDADAKPEWRLANLAYQRRAKWLLARMDEIFLPEQKEEQP